MSVHDCKEFGCTPSQDLHFDRDGTLHHQPDGGSDQVHTLIVEGYSVAMYRSPNTGDMVIDIHVPYDYEDSVTVNLNDDRLGLT